MYGFVKYYNKKNWNSYLLALKILLATFTLNDKEMFRNVLRQFSTP